MDIQLTLPRWTWPLRLTFLFILMIVSFPVWLFCFVMDWCFCCCLRSPASRRRYGRIVGVSLSYLWRLTLRVCCWICIETEGLDELSRAGANGRQVFITLNHSSFFDTVLFCALCPTALVGDCKTLMTKAVLSMPVMGRLAVAIGHLPVPFARPNVVGDFSVDKERLKAIMLKLDAHIDAGGHVALFPEGGINRINFRELQNFRAGGFEIAMRHDMEIWGWVMTGSGKCWPPDVSLGGAPAKIRVKAVRLHTSAKDAGASMSPTKETADVRSAAVALAEDVKATMQSTLDKFYD